ncbi:MAG TPA: alpha/beta hydrolase [Longimicrobiales bacterium]|nr:alpha/beta hydrolase [Longimicrobiales bacterium]
MSPPKKLQRQTRPPGGVFPNAEVQATLLRLYDAKLACWPVPYEEFDIRTHFGSTHIVAAGDRDAPPLLMLHQGSTPSFTWQPLIAPLAARYRTYAVDTIGDVGKSVLADPAQHPMNGEELASWLCQVAALLGIERCDVVAGSYGSWLAVHYATFAPARVRSLVLQVPMALPTWRQTAGVLARLMTMSVGSSPAKLERSLSYMMGDAPVVRELFGDWFTALIPAKCKVRIPPPYPISISRLESIQMPTLVIMGGSDPLIGDAERAARHALKHIRRVEVEIVSNGTHALHAGQADLVTARMLEFLDSVS